MIGDRGFLMRGDKGYWVKKLQEKLINLGYNLPNYGADGDYGNETEKTVKMFQKDNNLRVDGLAGQDTFGKINDLLESKNNNIIRNTKNFIYDKIAYTHVVRIDPTNLKCKKVSVNGYALTHEFKNFVNSNFFWWKEGKKYTIGWLISDGKVIHSRQRANDFPVGAFVVYKNNKVECKSFKDEELHYRKNDIKFCVQGYNLYPSENLSLYQLKNKMKDQFFNYAEVGYQTWRPVLGYNKSKNKAIIAVRPSSTAYRGYKTLKNLNCDVGIGLDGGGSTNLVVDGNKKRLTTRTLDSIIYWGF